MTTKHQVVVTKYDGAVYTHRVLMRTSDVFLEKAQETPRGSYYNALASTLFAWMAFEAYLNTVIQHLDPIIFSDERNFFRGRKYGGTFGKLRWILDKLGRSLTRTTERRRRVLVALHRLRNQLVHAGLVTYSGERRHAIDDEPPFMEGAWVEARVKIEQVQRYVGAVKDLCEWVNAEVRPRFEDPHLRRAAFEGTTQSQTSHGTVVRGRALPARAVGR